MDFQRGLTMISPAAAKEIIEAARASHLPVFVISTPRGAGREEFFDSARAVLPLDPPLQSSRSWEAFSDSLWEGLRLLGSDSAVIVWPDASQLRASSPRDYETSLSVLRDLADSVADPVATGGRPKEVSVYVAP